MGRFLGCFIFNYYFRLLFLRLSREYSIFNLSCEGKILELIILLIFLFRISLKITSISFLAKKSIMFSFQNHIILGLLYHLYLTTFSEFAIKLSIYIRFSYIRYFSVYSLLSSDHLVDSSLVVSNALLKSKTFLIQYLVMVV